VVAAAVQSAASGHEVRLKRAQKRRRKDAAKAAREKRKAERLRATKEIAKIVCSASAEGASIGAARVTFERAAAELDRLLPLKQVKRTAAAAARAGYDDDDGDDGDDDGDGDGDSEDSDLGYSECDGDDDDGLTSAAAAGEIAASAPEGGVSLAERVKALSPFSSGKAWDVAMKRQILLAAYHRMHARFELAQRSGRDVKPEAGTATAVASYFGANRSRVSEVLKEYAPHGLRFDSPHVEFVDSDCMERSARTDVKVVTDEQVAATRTFLRTRADLGSTTTWGQVHKHLTATTALDMSIRVMTDRLMELGFGVVPVHSAPVVDLRTDYWQRQRERFIVEYAAAREEEIAGKAVIVFVDESFVNLRHRRHSSVADLGGDNIVKPHRSGKKVLMRTGIGRGKLLIICHAITRHGLLARLGPDGDIDRPKSSDDRTAVSAELIYESGQSADDYHEHFDNFTCLKWAERQLMPAFRARFGPDMAMRIVLDNSGNHSAMRSDYVKANGARKAALAKVLTDNGVEELHVERKMDHGKPTKRSPISTSTTFKRTLYADQWMARAPDGAFEWELSSAVQMVYKRNPRLTWSQLEVLIDAGVRHARALAVMQCSALTVFCVVVCVCDYDVQGTEPAAGEPDDRKRGFHSVIWTPAYHSEANPIEKAWSIAKGFVATAHTGKRNITQLRQQLLLGLYGDPDTGHLGVTADSCTAAIEHTERELAQWMCNSDRIKALFPKRTAPSRFTIAAMNARRRQEYGPVVRPHRRGSYTNDAADPVDGEDEEDVVGIVIPPPAADAAAPAPAAASASARR
jgi:hypothetical protein